MSKPFGDELMMLSELRRRIDAAGSQKAVAEAAGVSQQFLTDVLKGRRAPSGALINWLGYKREIVYRRIVNG